MSGLMLEIGQEHPDVEVECIPGVTAAIGGAAVLGAPLIHDFALISLSDLLTPWEKIEKRLLAAAAADFVICLYNPSSKKRHDYLQKACDLILQYQPETLVCATVSQIGRDGEEKHIYTLKELRDLQVDMFTTVFIGNSQTREINGCMVTPRGYRGMKKAISYLVFAGTSEGRQLAEFFQKNQIPALFCVATAYGEELLEQTEEIRVHTGRMDEIQMRPDILELMKTGLQAVIDGDTSPCSGCDGKSEAGV